MPNQDQANEQLAIMKRDVVDVVSERVRQMTEAGHIQFPPNYSAENALKAAWLALQSVEDKNHKSALAVCTKDSIANALLDMVVQALSPVKKQCYFMVYGNKLVCSRSYFGSMALAKRVEPGADIYYGVVYEGDEFEYTIERGMKRIVKHVQSIDNVAMDKIKAAYCVIERDERLLASDIMTFAQIVQAWKQGQSYKSSGDGVHQKFTDQMAVKVVINRTCKGVINSSADDYLLEAINRSDETAAELGIEAEAAEHANGEVIDVQATIRERSPAENSPPAQSEPEREPAGATAAASNGHAQPTLGPGF